jgi:hypothetical protein
MSFSTPQLIDNETLYGTVFSPSADNNRVLAEDIWYWRVQAISFFGARGAYSAISRFTVDVTPPAYPQLLGPANQSGTNDYYTHPFRWSQVSDAVKYWLQLDSSRYYNSSELLTKDNVNGTSYTFNETYLHNGVWYWRIVALDAVGNVGELSTAPTQQFIADYTPPTSPSPLLPAEGDLTNQGTPELTWHAAGDPPITFDPRKYDAVASGVADYTLVLDTGSSFDNATGRLRVIAGVTGTGYNVSAALGDGTWYWRVSATDQAGNTGPVSYTQSFTVDTSAPAPPPILSMDPNGRSVDIRLVTLTWNASSDGWGTGIEGYVIQIDSSNSFGISTRHEYWPGNVTSFTPDYEFPDGQWYWRIAAIDRAGNTGAWSEPVPFSVNVATGLSPMMIILVGGGSGGIAILAVLGFVLYRRAKIPFVIKKIDQSIKLINKGEMPSAVPMRSRAELVQTIFRDKVAILSKEKIEEQKEKKVKQKPEKLKEPSQKKAPEVKPKEAEVKPKEAEAKQRKTKATAIAEAEEADVDMIVKELEKLESKEVAEPSEESEFMKREIEELDKEKRKKKE